MKEFKQNLEEKQSFEDYTFSISKDASLTCVQVGHYLYAPLPAWKLPNKPMIARYSKKHCDKLIRLELDSGEFVAYARKVDDNIPIGYHGQSHPTTLESYGF